MNNFFEYTVTKPIRLIELFSGLGAQAKALERLDADFEHWKTSDWDVSAVASYYKIHNSDDTTDYSKDYSVQELRDILFNMNVSTDGKQPMSYESINRKNEKWVRSTYNHFKATHNVGSVCNIHAKDLEIIDQGKYNYMLTWSFPCTNLSISGRQAGMTKGSGTASSLCWEVIRLLNECKEADCLPDILVMENVPQVHGKKFMPVFQEILNELTDIGYMNYWQDLNAKDYGVAQQRKRTFMISLLSNNTYEFPEPIPLKLRMKDYLDRTVDEKYYINNERSRMLIRKLLDSGQLENV